MCLRLLQPASVDGLCSVSVFPSDVVWFRRPAPLRSIHKNDSTMDVGNSVYTTGVKPVAQLR